MYLLDFISSFKEQLFQSFGSDFYDRIPVVVFSIASAVLTIIIGIWFGNLMGKLLVKILERRRVDKSVHYFLGRSVSAVIKIIFIVTALAKLGFNVTSFVAALGAAGITAGLGLKDSISQFASGIQILLNQPFHNGDFIEIEGIKGTVQEIHFMYTLLTTEDNRKVTVPNDHITSNNIINYTAGNIRRADLVYSIGYGENISKAKGVLYKVARENPHVLNEPSTRVVVKDHSESCVNLLCQVWCNSKDYMSTYYSMQEAVKLAFDENGIEIPFNQLDVHVSNDIDKDNNTDKEGY